MNVDFLALEKTGKARETQLQKPQEETEENAR